VLGKQTKQLREPGRVVADAAAGQQLPVPAGQGDVVVVFGPVDPAEHVHTLSFPCRRIDAPGPGQAARVTHAP